MKMVSGTFPVVSYAHTLMPSYTSGQIGFILASKNSVCVDMLVYLSIRVCICVCVCMSYHNVEVNENTVLLIK